MPAAPRWNPRPRGARRRPRRAPRAAPRTGSPTEKCADAPAPQGRGERGEPLRTRRGEKRPGLRPRRLRDGAPGAPPPAPGRARPPARRPPAGRSSRLVPSPPPQREGARAQDRGEGQGRPGEPGAGNPRRRSPDRRGSRRIGHEHRDRGGVEAVRRPGHHPAKAVGQALQPVAGIGAALHQDGGAWGPARLRSERIRHGHGQVDAGAHDSVERLERPGQLAGERVQVPRVLLERGGDEAGASEELGEPRGSGAREVTGREDAAGRRRLRRADGDGERAVVRSPVPPPSAPRAPRRRGRRGPGWPGARRGGGGAPRRRRRRGGEEGEGQERSGSRSDLGVEGLAQPLDAVLDGPGGELDRLCEAVRVRLEAEQFLGAEGAAAARLGKHPVDAGP